MTRETIITCDRCKLRGGLDMEANYYPILDKKNNEEPQDLCSECYDSFVAWWVEGAKGKKE